MKEEYSQLSTVIVSSYTAWSCSIIAFSSLTFTLRVTRVENDCISKIPLQLHHNNQEITVQIFEKIDVTSHHLASLRTKKTPKTKEYMLKHFQLCSRQLEQPKPS